MRAINQDLAPIGEGGYTTGYTLADAEAAADSYVAAVAPPSPTERQRHIERARVAREAFGALIYVRPAGRIVASDRAFGEAMALLPQDAAERKRVLNAATVRVVARADIASTAKLVFQKIAEASTGETTHCYRTRSQMGVAVGIEERAVTRAMRDLVDDGLIYLRPGTAEAGDRTTGRAFAVPALVPSDFERVGREPRVRHDLVALSKLIGKAGVAFAAKAAMNYRDLTWSGSIGPNLVVGPSDAERPRASDARSEADFDTRRKDTPQVPPTILARGGGGAYYPEPFWQGVVGLSSYRALNTAAGQTVSPSDPGRHDDPIRGVEFLTQSLSRTGAARDLTRYLTNSEIAENLTVALAAGKSITWGGFLAGLKQADERKWKRLRSELKTDAAIAAFATHDRSTNGNAKAGLPERIERFLASPAGSRFAVDAKLKAKLVRDAASAGEDTDRFRVERNNFVVWVGVREYRVPILEVIAHCPGEPEQDILLALDIVLTDINRRKAPVTADLPDELGRAVAAHLAKLRHLAPELPF